MKVLILSFSSNLVDEDSFIPNKIGLTFSCVEEYERLLKEHGYESEHICINKKRINKCFACGKRGWGICGDKHICFQKDDFNEIYSYMGNFDNYIFVSPVYFHEMSESAKTFFDRLKRCDAFNDDSKIKDKKLICIACAGGSGSGTEETLKSFDTLSYFLRTKMVGRVPVTKFDFDKQKIEMENSIKRL